MDVTRVSLVYLMPAFQFHVVIISWSGQEEAAQKIAAELEHVSDKLTVIYSNKEERDECGAGIWKKLPNSAFFGPKFVLALNDTPHESAMLLIHADTAYENWKFLLEKCRSAFAGIESLGIWAPDFTYTPWPSELVSLLSQPNAPHLVSVTQTDGIVLAMSPRVLARLRELDLHDNNFGWGIDWAAIAFAQTHGLLVLRDTSMRVQHARGRGYELQGAVERMWAFFAQLSMAERNQLVLLKQNHIYRRAEKRHLLKIIACRMLRRKLANPIQGFEKITNQSQPKPSK